MPAVTPPHHILVMALTRLQVPKSSSKGWLTSPEADTLHWSPAPPSTVIQLFTILYHESQPLTLKTSFLFHFHEPNTTVLQANAELLPDIIVGGAEEESALRRLEAAIAAEAEVLRQQIQSRAPVDGGGDAAADDGEEAIYAMASASVMSKRRAAIPQFNLSQQADIPLSRHVESAATLADAKVLPPCRSLVCVGWPNANL